MKKLWYTEPVHSDDIKNRHTSNGLHYAELDLDAHEKRQAAFLRENIERPYKGKV